MAPLETVDNLGNLILNESKDKREWTVKSAQEMSKKFLDEATQKAKENKDRIIEHGKYTGEKEKQKILSTAEMEAKKLILNAKESLIEEAFEKARERFRELKDDKKYKDILVTQIISSIGELTGKQFIVEVFEGAGLKLTDAVLSKIEKETKRKGLKIEVKEISEDMGGVIVREKAGKISIDNTFNSILERKKNDIRVTISEVLFE
jgi:V/A-type H+-transporting ATPase subunit E